MDDVKEDMKLAVVRKEDKEARSVCIQANK